MTPRVHAENLIWEFLGAYDNKNLFQEQFLKQKSEIIDCLVAGVQGVTNPVAECHCGKEGHALNSVNCPVHGYRRFRTQDDRITRLVDKLTDILAITQETTDVPCWQKIQNIEATAANAIATDLNILEGDE